MMLLPGIRTEAFATFDAAQAKSAARSDYELLLRCVEVGCGSVESFNARARQLLASAFQEKLDEFDERVTFAGRRRASMDAGRRRASMDAAAHLSRRAKADPESDGSGRRDGGRSAAGDRRHLVATVRLFARVCALLVALFALLGALAIRPALADCGSV